MAKEVFILAMLSLLSQVWTDSWPDLEKSEEVHMLQKSKEPQEPQKPQESQDATVTPAIMLVKSLINTQLSQQMNKSMTAIFQDMTIYELYARNVTERVLAEHRVTLAKHISIFKSYLKNTERSNAVYINKNGIEGRMLKCMVEETKLDTLFEEINKEIKKCGTVVMEELVNMISKCVNETQTFMSISQVIENNIESCGLSSDCRWDMARDAVAESIQVPPKVFALATKIQSIALKTIVSVDSCGLESLRQVTETGLGILDRIFACIDETKSDEHDDDL